MPGVIWLVSLLVGRSVNWLVDSLSWLVGWLVQFLEFMCPGHREKEVSIPLGMDSKVCSRKIMGTYDDRDYGW